MTNEIYTGKIINGKEEVTDFLTSKREKKEECDWQIVEKPELRIIEDAQFARVGKLLAQRSNSFQTSHERQSNKHLFSTLIKCECCGFSFRRTERAYKNTYIKWVCSGRNANGKASCPNQSKIDEQALKDALKDYFVGILGEKDQVIKNIVAEFNRIYYTKDENSDYEHDLSTRLSKATKARKKYMDMYEDELITRDELREKVGNLNVEIGKHENELKLVQYNLSKGDQLEKVLQSTLKDLESILDMEGMTNAQLKRLVDKIVVGEHGKIDVYLKLLSDIGLDQSVLVSSPHT